MPVPVIMPKQGQSVETCIITKWFKSMGDRVAAGEILFSYETDKAAFDMESPATGTLLALFYNEGNEVPVLTNVAAIGEPGDDISHLNPGLTVPSGRSASSESEKETPETNQTSTDEALPRDSHIRVSPRARKIAREKGIDIDNITGSGPNGRIISGDIERLLSAGSGKSGTPPSIKGEFSEKPLSNLRKLVSKAMLSSLQNSAQLTHHMSADARKILEARRIIKEDSSSGKPGEDITINDMVCWCVIRALKKFPDMNSHFLGESIKTFHGVHLGIAVDTSRGLMVPALKDADEMDIDRLSGGLKSLADSCRKGSIDPELIRSTSASFTVSNLGSYGVEMFTPVINLPQVAILGICAIIKRPVDLNNNTFGFVPYMGLSLTYDHRAVDGGPATLFLREVKEQIEGFEYRKQ